jgi:hypothetical protein
MHPGTTRKGIALRGHRRELVRRRGAKRSERSKDGTPADATRPPPSRTPRGHGAAFAAKLRPSGRGTPNTEVKPCRADGTAACRWESRSLPGFFICTTSERQIIRSSERVQEAQKWRMRAGIDSGRCLPRPARGPAWRSGREDRPLGCQRGARRALPNNVVGDQCRCVCPTSPATTYAFVSKNMVYTRKNLTTDPVMLTLGNS